MQFKLKIGSDVIDFINIETNPKTGIPKNDAELVIFNALSSNPSFIEITDLLYNPEEDSVWNGTDFIDAENREARPLSKMDDGFKKIAVLVDNKYKYFHGFRETPENEMIIAMLLSNPEVISE